MPVENFLTFQQKSLKSLKKYRFSHIKHYQVFILSIPCFPFFTHVCVNILTLKFKNVENTKNPSVYRGKNFQHCF